MQLLIFCYRIFVFMCLTKSALEDFEKKEEEKEVTRVHIETEVCTCLHRYTHYNTSFRSLTK